MLYNLRKSTILLVRQRYNIWKFNNNKKEKAQICRLPLVEPCYKQIIASKTPLLLQLIYGKKVSAKLRKNKQSIIGTDLSQFGTFLRDLATRNHRNLELGLKKS